MTRHEIKPVRYEIRPSKNTQFIDIVPAGAGSGTGYEVRIPVRLGRESHAEKMADLVLLLLNEYHRVSERGDALRSFSIFDQADKFQWADIL